jgi:hypothetical protein
MKTKGLLVQVYRDNLGDCTINGISSKNDSLILVGNGPSEGTEENSVKIVTRKFRWGNYIHAEPLIYPKEKSWPMFGGNFIFSCDSRFPSKYPIPVHDRFE